MKKIAWLALALCLCFALTGCGRYVSLLPGSETPAALREDEAGDEGGFAQRPLMTFLGWDALAESYYSDTPAALSYRRTAADGTVGCESYVFDRTTIITACDTLRGMTVTGESPEAPAAKAEYVLTMADGREYAVVFGLLSDGSTRVLSTHTGDYTVEGGDALWSVAFPAYSADYDVFDLYFDKSVRDFADGFEENRPVSVGFRMRSGASITSEDPAAVEGVFRALSNAAVIVVENLPDQNVDMNDTREYFFTMADGTRYSFLFAQRCLVVTANAAFGPVYYWLTGMDDLWAVEIASQNRNEVFAGDRVGELREDVKRAVGVAEGNYDADLTVLGVFVEYTIGEESGYIALSEEKAAEFVRTLGAIPITGDAAADLTGDKLTVSITLSDSSGPILYFIGDAVQQVVGTNYACDGGTMTALRNWVLDLAADGENTAVVEGDSTN